MLKQTSSMARHLPLQITVKQNMKWKRHYTLAASASVCQTINTIIYHEKSHYLQGNFAVRSYSEMSTNIYSATCNELSKSKTRLHTKIHRLCVGEGPKRGTVALKLAAAVAHVVSAIRADGKCYQTRKIGVLDDACTTGGRTGNAS